MGLPHKLAKRSALKPKPGNKEAYCAADGDAGGGTPNKQYKQTGPKYSGPNYPQSQEQGAGKGKVVPFGGK